MMVSQLAAAEDFGDHVPLAWSGIRDHVGALRGYRYGRIHPRMFRNNKRRSALALAALGVLGSMMLGSGPAHAAKPLPPPPTVQVAAASDVPVGVRGETFHTFTTRVYMNSASTPYLTGFANADGPFYVDDVLEIEVCSVSSQLCTTPYRHDFSNNCTAGGPQPTGLIGLGRYLNPGLNIVTFRLKDLCGQHEGSSDIYLTGYGVIDPTLVGSNECKGNWSKWLGGIIGQPFYDSRTGIPYVGADHKIHGSGTVDVRAKVNCSARVQITLQTRVCNRFGGNCNSRDIDKTKIDPLPDGGLYLKDLTGACRSGRDDYRVQVHVSYTTFDGFEGPIPVLAAHDDYGPDGDKGWTKLTC